MEYAPSDGVAAGEQDRWECLRGFHGNSWAGSLRFDGHRSANPDHSYRVIGNAPEDFDPQSDFCASVGFESLSKIVGRSPCGDRRRGWPCPALARTARASGFHPDSARRRDFWRARAAAPPTLRTWPSDAEGARRIGDAPATSAPSEAGGREALDSCATCSSKEDRFKAVRRAMPWRPWTRARRSTTSGAAS